MNNIDDLKDTLKRLAFRDRGDSLNLVINLDDVFDELDELKTDLLQNVSYCEHEPDKTKIDYSRLEDVPCLKCGKMVCIAPL